jgi:hypothetical protein
MIPGQAQQFFEAAAAQSGGGGGDPVQVDRSLRFNDDDSAHLSRTLSSSGNRRTWTLSWWMKLGNLSTNRGLFGMPGTSSGQPQFYSRLGTDDKLYVYEYNTSGTYQFIKKTTAVLRDVSAWYHCVFQFDSTQSTAEDGFKIYLNGTRLTDWDTNNLSNYVQDYQGAWNSNANTGVHIIGQSDGYFDGYMAEIHFVDGQALEPTAFAGYDDDNNWNPLSYGGSYGTNGFYLKFADNSSVAALGTDSSGNNNTWTVNNFNVGAIIYSADANYTTDANYLLSKTEPFDGSSPNSKINESTGAITNSNSRGVWSNTARTYIRWDAPSPIEITSGVDFYGGAYNDAAEVATLEIYYTDGTSTSGTFTSSSSSYMGRVTGVTSGKSLDYVQVSCANACFTAIRVNGSFITDTNATINDSLIDTPTNYTADSGNNGGNYCQLNPLDRQSTNGTLSNGNLDITQTTTQWAMYRSTMFVSSGKWYWECTLGNNQYSTVGICTDAWSMASSSNAWANEDTSMYGYYIYNGNKYNGGSGVSYASADTSAAGSVIGVALDMDNGTLTFYKDGTSLGTAYTGLTGKNVSPTHWLYNQTNADSYNFGQRSFEHTPPANHLSLCTQNLGTPAVADGSTAMDVLLYDGTNNIGHSVTGLSFAPDFVWIKCRSDASTDHVLGNKINEGSHLASNTTGAEGTGLIQSLDSGGFSLASNSGRTNQSGRTYIGWCWDGGTSTSSNTDGSVTSSVRANQTAGFSVVTATLPNYYTNYTIGHGLNATPHFIIGKNRAESNQWDVYHQDVGIDKLFRLNQDSAVSSATSNQDSYYPTSPTTSVFGFVGNNTTMNFVWYVFTEVAGFSSFGSYIGNGDADGPFLHTGFRPRWVLVRRTDTGSMNWVIYDTERNTSNVAGKQLYPNLDVAEADAALPTHARLDFVSNGIKLRGSHNTFNANGGTMVYAAFAEHPFKTARAR